VRGRGVAAPVPSSCPYSPTFVEKGFSEIRQGGVQAIHRPFIAGL
jgi:hypothetical protein